MLIFQILTHLHQDSFDQGLHCLRDISLRRKGWFVLELVDLRGELSRVMLKIREAVVAG